MPSKCFRRIYHDATLTRHALDGATLSLFVELDPSGGGGGGSATITFDGVIDADAVRSNLDARDRPPEIVGIVHAPKPPDARYEVIVDLSPSPALRVRCRSVYER